MGYPIAFHWIEYDPGILFSFNNTSTSLPCISKILIDTLAELFDSGILDALADVHDSVSLCNQSNWDSVKVRYYHNDEYYDPHTDKAMQFLAFYYINKEPKKYTCLLYTSPSPRDS